MVINFFIRFIACSDPFALFDVWEICLDHWSFESNSTPSTFIESLDLTATPSASVLNTMQLFLWNVQISVFWFTFRLDTFYQLSLHFLTGFRNCCLFVFDGVPKLLLQFIVLGKTPLFQVLPNSYRCWFHLHVLSFAEPKNQAYNLYISANSTCGEHT
jgi:hypothetical protein